MSAVTDRMARLGLRRVRRGPVQVALVDGDGVEQGRYGGRAGDRWAELADGTTVTEGTAASADVVLGVLVRAIEERIAACPWCSTVVDDVDERDAVHRTVGSFLTIAQVEAIEEALPVCGVPIDRLHARCLVVLMARTDWNPEET